MAAQTARRKDNPELNMFKIVAVLSSGLFLALAGRAIAYEG